MFNPKHEQQTVKNAEPCLCVTAIDRRLQGLVDDWFDVILTNGHRALGRVYVVNYEL